MKVRVDPEKRQGHTMCAPAGLEDKAREAMRSCPEQAISAGAW